MSFLPSTSHVLSAANDPCPFYHHHPMFFLLLMTHVLSATVVPCPLLPLMSHILSTTDGPCPFCHESPLSLLQEGRVQGRGLPQWHLHLTHGSGDQESAGHPITLAIGISWETWEILWEPHGIRGTTEHESAMESFAWVKNVQVIQLCPVLKRFLPRLFSLCFAHFYLSRTNKNCYVICSTEYYESRSMYILAWMETAIYKVVNVLCENCRSWEFLGLWNLCGNAVQ